MISVIIQDNGEPNVVKFTYENIYKEIKDIEDSEIIVAPTWTEGIGRAKNKYVCLAEVDCLFSSGYFSSQLGLIKKNPHLRRLGILGSAVGVNQFGNRFYGWSIGSALSSPTILEDGRELRVGYHTLEPVRIKKSNYIHPVQIVFVPGAVLRTSMLLDYLKDNRIVFENKDLVRMSSALCLKYWHGETIVNINPNATYVTTEKYVNDLSETEDVTEDIIKRFKRESI